MSGTTTLLTEAEGRAALEWMRENEWSGGVEVLVSTRAYSGRIDPEWVVVHRVATGATPYPVKADVPDRGEGQWRLAEVLAVRVVIPVHPDFPFPCSADGIEVRP